MRRYEGLSCGQKFLGNKTTKEVHDLNNEKIQCQIDLIIGNHDEAIFYTLQSAHDSGYNNCKFCIGDKEG